MKEVVRFDHESFCVVHLAPHSSVVQVTSNLADAEIANQYAKAIRENGGHVFHVVSAGILVAALHLIKDKP